MVEVVSSVLTHDIDEVRDLILRCEGVVDRVSVDIIDGKFADNKTIDPNLLSSIDTSLKIDYHLMVFEPINWLEKCLRGQADRVIGHVERMRDQSEFVGKAQEVGVKVGLALDLESSVEELDESILTNLDMILVMSVKAGFGGQKFREKAIDKIKKLDEIRKKDETQFRIHVDGGVTFDNIKEVVSAGADEVSVGRLLFKGDVAGNVRKFHKAAE